MWRTINVPRVWRAIKRPTLTTNQVTQRIPREERGRSHRFTGRFGFALGEIYGPDRKFGLWGRSGGWHILQGRKDSRWTAVQNAAYGQLRGALIMGVGHMQTSVAAAARRMWVATVDSTATSRGVRGEPGRPADINNAVGHRKTPQHCKERSAARATEGVRESSFLAPRCRVRVDTIGTSRRRRREVGCRRAEGPSVELLALPAGCFGPRRWIVEDEAWRWRMGLGVREQ